MKHKLGGFEGFVLGLLYTVVIVGLFGVILYDELRFLEVLILSLIIYGLIYLISLSRTAVKVIVISSITACVITAILCWLNESFLEAFIDEFTGIYEIWYKITFNIPLNLDYLHYDETCMIAITIIASILLLFILNKHNSFYILTLSIFALFIFSWFMTAIESKFLFIVFCVLTVLSYLGKVYMKKSKMGLVSGDLSLGKMLLFTMPVILIPVLIILFIPKSNQPIQWEWMDVKVNNLLSSISQRFNYIELENFSLSSIGFSDQTTKRLGGAVNPSNIEVLKVKTAYRTYLRGAVYYWYENSTWTRSNVITYNVSENEVKETRNGWKDIPVENIFPEASEDDKLYLQSLRKGELDTLLFPSYSLDVEIRNMITNNIFLPQKSIMPVRNETGASLPVYELDGGVLLCENRLKRGDTYKLSYIQPMYGEALLKKGLSFSDNLYDKAINSLLARKSAIYNQNIEEIDFEELQTSLNEVNLAIQNITALKNKSMEIESVYTLLPDNIPIRINELAAELTEDLKTNYEKTVAIEKYLRDNHTYTLSPESVPIDRDFVDYFLFDKKEGYCTYYASAMVVMLRSLGIPSRYVEGYVLPPEHTTDNVYTVLNNNAHAWVEVYFEGFGWLVFEPTSYYAGVMDYKTVSWSVSEGSDMSYYDMMEQYRQRTSSMDFLPVDSSPIIAEDQNNFLNLILVFSGCIVVLCIFINFVVIIINKVKLKRSKKEKSVLLRYNHMIKWLTLTGYKINPGESAREFAGRIDTVYYFTHSFREITEIFSKVRYGNHNITTEEATMVKSTYNKMKKQILKEIGVKRFLPLRTLILGI